MLGGVHLEVLLGILDVELDSAPKGLLKKFGVHDGSLLLGVDGFKVHDQADHFVQVGVALLELRRCVVVHPGHTIFQVHLDGVAQAIL